GSHGCGNRVVTASGPAAVNEGAAYALALNSGTGPAPVTWTVNWGDGVVEAVSGGAASATHYYPDGPASYAIKARLVDANGSWPAAPVPVAVANVAPAVAAVANQTVNVGQPLTVTTTFTDPGFTSPAAGTSETFTAQVNWGDGTDTFVP